jgi:CRP/FNR family cyclic AMP-dependent transcriptional regulator
MPEVEHFKNSKDVVQFKAGDVIFTEGEPGEIMYGVRAGEVEITHEGKSLAFLGPGSIFGEMALIDRAPRAATAVAFTDCTLVPVDRHRFQFLIHETSTFATRVMQTLSHRLREVEGLADKDKK